MFEQPYLIDNIEKSQEIEDCYLVASNFYDKFLDNIQREVRYSLRDISKTVLAKIVKINMTHQRDVGLEELYNIPLLKQKLVNITSNEIKHRDDPAIAISITQYSF